MKSALISIAAGLVATLIGACATAPPRPRVLSIAEVLASAQTLDGRTVTVEANIRDTGVHGMFVLDPRDRKSGLNMRIDPAFARSDAVRDMHRMLIIDGDREQRLGVIADLTGTFQWRPGELSWLVVTKIENLRWGTGI